MTNTKLIIMISRDNTQLDVINSSYLTYQHPHQPSGYPIHYQQQYINNNKNFTDIEEGTSQINVTQDNDRRPFIKKVYSILTVQLLCTFLISLIMYISPGTKAFIKSQGGQALLWLSVIGAFAILITIMCCQEIARKFPGNYIALSSFTLCISYMVGTVTLAYTANSVLVAFGATMGITFALTIYAWQTKIDYTVYGSLLLSVLTGIIIASIVNIFLQNGIVEMVIAGISAILFSFYIIYDTQMIVSGDHEYSFDEDDYVFAAIALYIDIINLFLNLLKLIGNLKN